MCFAPQRRALFRHLNFQKWSEHGVLCAFWFRNVLHATTAIFNLSSGQLAPRPPTLPSRTTNHQRNTVFRDFPTFSGTWIFFLLRLSLFDLLLFSSLLFPSLLFPSLPLLFSSSSSSSASASASSSSSSSSASPSPSLLFSSLLWLLPPLLFICPYCRKFDF